MNRRDNFLYVFIGTNRTGKSSIARRHVIQWKRANPGKKVIGFDPQRRFKGLFDVYIDPENENWALDMLEERDCLLVVDDLRILNDSGHPSAGLKKLMYYRCDFNIDIMAIFHNPSDVLNCISDYATHYFIFMTNVQDGKFKQKIPNYRLCVVASDEVNKYVVKHGKGVFPACNFPYIVVNSERQTLTAINMEKKY